MLDSQKNALGLSALVGMFVFFLGILAWQSSEPPAENPHSTQQQQAAQTAEHVKSPSAAEERIADYTKALAWLTGVLAVATIGLGIISVVQLVLAARRDGILERA